MTTMLAGRMIRAVDSNNRPPIAPSSFGAAGSGQERRMSDELHQPLGLPPAGRTRSERADGPSRAFTPRISFAGLVYSLIGATALGAGFYVWRYGDPNGGWPRAVARIEAYKPPPVAEAPRDPQPTGTIERRPERQTGQEVENQSGVKVTRAGGGQAPGALIIQLDQAASVSLQPAPDKRLVERGRFGPLPRIGADGAKPYEIYARPLITSKKLKADAPRIALIVGGLGLSSSTTDAALEKLPADVSFAFAPYGESVQGDAAKARERGHETFLQAPMEPFDYPQNDPGPHTLTVRASDKDIESDLSWLMSRFAGYVGVVNFLGARFMSNAAAMTPVMRELAQRGVAFVDDGSAPQSLAATIGAQTGAVSARADVVLDADPRGETIEAALTRLETIARQKGAALGFASAIPQSVEQVARFARGLERRGIALVPASALLSRGGGAQAENRR